MKLAIVKAWWEKVTMEINLQELIERATRELIDQGKIIEAGFLGLRTTAIPGDAPPLQIEEMRMAFFAGAQHLFASIMGVLEPGGEPTEKDLARMDLIQAELDKFVAQYKATHASL